MKEKDDLGLLIKLLGITAVILSLFAIIRLTTFIPELW